MNRLMAPKGCFLFSYLLVKRSIEAVSTYFKNIEIIYPTLDSKLIYPCVFPVLMVHSTGMLYKFFIGIYTDQLMLCPPPLLTIVFT